MKHMCSVALLLIVFVGQCGAELRLASLFSDGMVLQREQAVPVWGWAKPGEKVGIAFAGQKKVGTADKEGRFTIHLDPMVAAEEPRTLSVKTRSASVNINDVLVGEVWLCSGQSNMQLAMCDVWNFAEEKKRAHHSGLRTFFVELAADPEVQDECGGQWVACSPDELWRFSATAYYFGRELQRKLDVPVGLVLAAWGSTRIEAWSPLASLEDFDFVQDIKRDKDRQAGSFNEKHAEKLLKDRDRKMKEQGKWLPVPQGAVHPQQDKNYPGNLYNAMIHPLVPYGMRGAIWYQGESNTGKLDEAVLYEDMLSNLVVQWREDWKSDFPFYAVQLPAFNPRQQKHEGWAIVREAVLNMQSNVPKTGMAVTIDVGDEKEIHPKNKWPVGQRLARQALAKTYGIDIPSSGPVYQRIEKEHNKLRIYFDSIGSGLVAKGNEPLKWFYVAGADRQFYEAQASIVGDTVEVISADVAEPVSVRYAWVNYPEGCNLYNKEGFPASPFRSDTWRLE